MMTLLKSGTFGNEIFDLVFLYDGTTGFAIPGPIDEFDLHGVGIFDKWSYDLQEQGYLL